MTNLIEKKFINEELGIEITSYIDKQQIIWFLGKDVAEILGYSKTRDALSRHVDNEDKNNYLLIIPASTKRGRWVKMPASTKRRRWVKMPASTKRGRWVKVVVCVLI